MKKRNLRDLTIATSGLGKRYTTPRSEKKKTSAPPPKNEGPRRDKDRISNQPWWFGDGSQVESDGEMSL